MGLSKFILFLVATSFSFLTIGQEKNRYMVFFTDKDATPYVVGEPSAFLSQRSIDRRNHHAVETTQQDLPVDPQFVSNLNAMGCDVFFTTRWMNGALVQMEESMVSSVLAMDFVESVEYIAPGAVLSREKNIPAEPEEFFNPSVIFATSDLQNEMLGVDIMHEEGYDGAGKLVAVFDAGFRYANVYKPFEHLFTTNKILATWNMVDNSGNVYDEVSSHGSSVLSLISGQYEDDFIESTLDP